MTTWMTRWLPWQQRRTPHRCAALRWTPEVGELVAAPDRATVEVVG